jgi:ornithine carbamoyltransferase
MKKLRFLFTIPHFRCSPDTIITIQELAKYSPVPVINALSSLWHPTQILADLLTLHEHAHLFDSNLSPPPIKTDKRGTLKSSLPELRSLTVAYVGDSANVLHDMLVTYPRLGHTLRVASPEQYRAPTQVWDRVKKLGCDKGIWWGTDPKEAVEGADVVVTDTWFVLCRLLAKFTELLWQDLNGTRGREGGTFEGICWISNY